MPTYGKARTATINALKNCEEFSRKGFAMRGVEGAVFSTGYLDIENVNLYRKLTAENNISYTVISYNTPIAWVTRDGKVTVPDIKYSNTTTQHQHLCRVYLNN